MLYKFDCHRVVFINLKEFGAVFAFLQAVAQKLAKQGSYYGNRASS